MLPRVSIYDYSKYYYYYSENNLGCSIQMFGWSYIMTHGPMEICHVALKNEFNKNINIKLVST